MPTEGRRPDRPYNRAYQACINCRRKKVKCIVDNDEDGQPQSFCTRCRRELRQCVFTADRGGPSGVIPSTHHRTVVVEANHAVPEMSSSTFTNNDYNQSISIPFHESNLKSSDIGNDESPVSYDAEEGTNALPSQSVNNDYTIGAQDAGCRAAAEVCHEVWPTVRHRLSTPSANTLETWSNWRFVQTGLLSAEEAVTYADLFFRNMAALSPIVHDYYSDHENHHTLIRRDPVLCCTIMAISSRHHILDTEGGLTRGYHIHDRLWKYCQSLFDQAIWNERRAVRDQMRYLGLMESMLLITEWHPRASHLPVESDYFGSREDLFAEEQNLSRNKVPNKWLREVEEIAERSDRTSWMLLGNALTLGHELDLFDAKEDMTVVTVDGAESILFSNYLIIRRNRLRRILFIYITQLASRLGCSYPKTPFHQVIVASMHQPNTCLDENWHNHVSLWIELSRLIRSSSEFLFPSKSVTQDLLHSGRYAEFLDHFRPLLAQWWEQYSRITNGSVSHRLLSIDYQFVRLYINSMALQAVSHRVSTGQNPTMGSQLEKTSDYAFIREVIDGCTHILETVIKLANDNHLKYIPTRLHIRIASASIYLIHALALGARQSELTRSIALVDSAVNALRVHAVDDVHLGVRYASLLQKHLKGLRKRFIRAQDTVSSFPLPQYETGSGGSDVPLPITNTSGEKASSAGPSNSSWGDAGTPMSGSDWVAIPMEASNGGQQQQCSSFMEFLFDMDPSDMRFFWDV
ncbi:Transcriptional activator ARO80 [Cladobotryum mycophilum]|uniref:Transcriptional activator ARO80 n=1 Tax=Cladobotryum mycophilum TaxID=491253 RepID=A0ABR0S922_9HYPO